MKKSLFCKNEIVNKVFNDLKKIKTKKLKDGIIVLTDIGFYALDKNYFRLNQISLILISKMVKKEHGFILAQI